MHNQFNERTNLDDDDDDDDDDDAVEFTIDFYLGFLWDFFFQLNFPFWRISSHQDSAALYNALDMGFLWTKLLPFHPASPAPSTLPSPPTHSPAATNWINWNSDKHSSSSSSSNNNNNNRNNNDNNSCFWIIKKYEINKNLKKKTSGYVPE